MRRSPGVQRSCDQKQIRLFGRQYPVMDRVQVRRRTYLLLDRLSTSARERYLAFDPHAGPQGRPVAILVLPRSASSRQHLEVLQRLGDSNDSLPTILDFDVRPRGTVVVLKWVSGPTLEHYLNHMKAGNRPRISPIIAFQRIRALAHGLSRRHRNQQIVHGDIKPQNLIVSTDPGRFMLIDYGSAWCVERTAARNIGDGANAVYAAPELQNGQAFVDFRCDQFSMSVILFQLITFQIPYEELGGKAGRPEFLPGMAKRLQPPGELSPHRSLIPNIVWRGINRIVARGLALNPNDRYPTPEAWLDDLDAVYLDVQRPPTISPVYDRMTRVVSWFANHLFQ